MGGGGGGHYTFQDPFCREGGREARDTERRRHLNCELEALIETYLWTTCGWSFDRACTFFTYLELEVDDEAHTYPKDEHDPPGVGEAVEGHAGDCEVDPVHHGGEERAKRHTQGPHRHECRRVRGSVSSTSP